MHHCFRLSLIILLLPGPSLLFAQWAPIASGTIQDLNDILNFSGGPPIVIVGDQGTILRSTDGGASWTTPASGTVMDLTSVNVHTSTQYWIGGAGGTVLFSNDGAQSWTDASPAGIVTPLQVFSRTSGLSYAVGENGTILKGEADLIGGGFNGVTWTTQTSGTTANLHHGNGSATGLAYVVGDNGTILKTLNGGTTWTAQTSGTSLHLYNYADIAEGADIVVGQQGIILKSTDAGTTWVQKLGGLTEDLYDIETSVLNANFMVAVGSGGLILKSTDNGESWCMQESGTTAALTGVQLENNNVYYAVGSGGLVLKTTNGGGSCTALPVELTRFEGYVGEDAIVLRWETATETNNSHFEVHHLEEGTYRTLGVVPGQGTSRRGRQYVYRVEDLAAGEHTFRLRQVDFDGLGVLSDPVTVLLPATADLAFSRPAPNPFQRQTAFTLTTAVTQHIRVEVFNVLGQRVALLHDAPIVAHQPLSVVFSGAALPSGRYLIRATGEHSVSSLMVVRRD